MTHPLIVQGYMVNNMFGKGHSNVKGKIQIW
jgi:hypothetical protein